MAVTIVAAPWIVRLYTLNVKPARLGPERSLATFFLRWFMPQIVFYGLGSVATGLLNAHRRFAAPMFAPILNNLVVIGVMIAFAKMPGPSHPTVDGVTTAQRYLLAVGTTAGVVAMTAALWPSLRRLGFRARWRLDWTSEPVRRIVRLAAWVFLYVLVNQLGLLQIIVLSAGRTGFTAFISAFTFFQLPHAIFAVSIMTALLPSLSGQWAAGERDAFRGLLARGIRSTAFIVVPATPQINANPPRAVGDGVMLFIAVHELIHACGLSNGDHNPDDLFSGFPQARAGNKRQDDKLEVNQQKRLPPLFLTTKTAGVIRALWK